MANSKTAGKHFVDQFLTVRTHDPETKRRGYLLSILLLAVMIPVVFLAVYNLALAVMRVPGDSGAPDQWLSFFAIDILCIAFTAGLLWLNLKGYTRLVSVIFLLMIVVAESFLFDFNQLDRLTLMYVIPVLGASFVIGPAASFVFATLSILGFISAFLTHSHALGFNYVSIFSLYSIAAVAWLAARTLERALRDIRKHVEELDQRVAERTADLAQSLQREHVEAQKNDAILQSVADGVIVFDENRQAIVANPAACAIAGYGGADELVGNHLDTVMERNALSPELQSAIRAMFDGETVTRAGVKGEWDKKVVLASFTRVTLPVTEQYGTVMVVRDITQEAEVDRMKSEFVSLVSHELRAPMTAIKGYLELLLGQGETEQMRRDYLEIAVTNADRLNQMVEELLDVSRIEAGKIEIAPRPVSLRRIVNAVARMFQKGLADKGVELRLNIPDDLPDVRADQNRLNQIMTNLLSNALKYTPSGHIEVRAQVVGEFVQVDIRDTGIGMSAQDIQKLFARFFRASTARSSDIPGTGLGLSIVRSLVEMHGGKIWVESAEGQGSTFCFTLPVMPQGQDVDAASGVATKILIADGDLRTAQWLRQQLETHGYMVLLATFGQDVLPLARREKPDLILFDVLIQGANGIEVMHHLKHEAATQSIPIIAISIGPGEQKDFMLDAVDYLAKPVDPDKLLTTVRRVLTAQAIR